ncbi:hypothetical protein [Adhaeretor mobilis]|uniref:hypothetical protein n=1 Tax=Adhaeretor mobilis TaxID=1930276 RepID=UPI0011A20AD7|nr:hypothetical protein [Adhaeretor mobilis]
MIRRLASLHWLQRGEVRQLQRYYQDAMTSCCPSRRTSFPSFGDTSVALVIRSLTDECAAKAWSCLPGVSDREVAEEATGSLKFLGNLNHPFAMFLTDAGRTVCTRPLRCSSVALGHRKAKAPAIGSFDAQ